ncbi:MAG: hypothetical protein WKF82_12850 [Nocardioidaceae bacterium]
MPQAEHNRTPGCWSSLDGDQREGLVEVGLGAEAGEGVDGVGEQRFGFVGAALGW